MADKLEPQKVLEAIENCGVENQQVVLQYAYETIKQLMTDAVPVVHAHWVKHDNSCWSCSQCDEVISMRRYMENKLRYCSWCGAKIDEKDGEQDG